MWTPSVIFKKMQQFSYLYGRRCLVCFILALCTSYAIFNFWYNIQRYSYTMDKSIFDIPQITTTTAGPVIMYWEKLQGNLSCHYSTQDDALESVTSKDFSVGNNSIFFHETSCRGGINSRQACAVESAARLHPNWQVNLLFSSPITEKILTTSNLAKLLQFRNIKLSRLHIEEYGNGTVVEDILKTKLKKSAHPMEHTADIIRILTLHKFGGVYLDTDSILIKNLEALPPNWIGQEADKQVSSGAMAFSKDGFGGNLTTAILKELRDSFDPSSWSYNGPKAIKRVLMRLCPETYTSNCKDLKIFEPIAFYPVHYSYGSRYFKNGTIDEFDKSYMHHMWNYLTKNLKIEINSPYAKLARKFCPTIYEMYGNEFGV